VAISRIEKIRTDIQGIADVCKSDKNKKACNPERLQAFVSGGGILYQTWRFAIAR